MPDIISKNDASEAGLTHFFTGKPCGNGHVCMRYVNGGGCFDCFAQKNIERKAYKKEYYERTKELTKSRAKEWYENNKEKALERVAKRQREKHREVRDYQNQYYSDKYHNDPLENLRVRLKASIRSGMMSIDAKKNSKTQNILGCSWEQFRQHIEDQFCDGMGWHNASEWHLDHIIPRSTAKSIEDVERLNHFSNFQPLWALDNIKKSNKIEVAG